MLPREQRGAFHRDGFIVVEDFLPPALHARIAAEVDALRGRHGRRPRATLGRRAFLRDRRYQRLLRYTSSRNAPPLFYVQRIRNGSERVRPDAQKNRHSDTFHPTMKAWYFFDNVAEDAGAFHVRPRALIDRRWRAFAGSTRRASRRGADRYATGGSPRISQDELASLGPPPRRFGVRANTLVVANTHGLHARRLSSAPSSRREIWAYARGNPFVPFAVTGMPLLDRSGQVVLRAWWRRENTRASRSGSKPTWRLELELACQSSGSPDRQLSMIATETIRVGCAVGCPSSIAEIASSPRPRGPRLGSRHRGGPPRGA